MGVESRHIYRLGPGAVVDLAEGAINQPSKMTVMITIAVQARLIPFHKIDSVIALLPAEMKGFLLTIVKRTLALPSMISTRSAIQTVKTYLRLTIWLSICTS